MDLGVHVLSGRAAHECCGPKVYSRGMNSILTVDL
jgi:hypothetical protein